MTDDLRALANDYARAYDGVEGGISRLAHAVLTLLTSLEAAERRAERAGVALKVAVELLETMPKKQGGEKAVVEWLQHRNTFLIAQRAAALYRDEIAALQEGQEEKP